MTNADLGLALLTGGCALVMLYAAFRAIQNYRASQWLQQPTVSRECLRVGIALIQAPNYDPEASYGDLTYALVPADDTFDAHTGQLHRRPRRVRFRTARHVRQDLRRFARHAWHYHERLGYIRERYQVLYTPPQTFRMKEKGDWD